MKSARTKKNETDLSIMAKGGKDDGTQRRASRKEACAKTAGRREGSTGMQKSRQAEFTSRFYCR